MLRHTHTFSVLQNEAASVELAISHYNEWEAKQEAMQLHVAPYKAKKIELISKEKSAFWNEKSTSNLYSYTVSYVDVDALFRFAQQLGLSKAIALAQQQAYRWEPPDG